MSFNFRGIGPHFIINMFIFKFFVWCHIKEILSVDTRSKCPYCTYSVLGYKADIVSTI